MNVKDIINKIKEFISKKILDFKALSKTKKLALVIASVAVILSIVFGVKYMNNNKYKVLFSGLNSTDAASITKELESENIDMKIQGDSILVPKDKVDELRLKLSENISNGSKGYELMDEGSSFGMTDEEFKIKKQRMLQGEIEKTIKTFSQVADARVQIINGEESVFAKETQPGSAAVTITLNPGESLDISQVRSIMSLVSASCENIPKQNVEVVDQNMNLLSEGLYDENGKEQATNSNGLYIARKAEKELNSDLERAISSILESMFGQGKVVVKVNSDLNFDTKETTEIKIDPDRVALKEDRKTNKTSQDEATGGNIDNNMNTVGGNESNSNESKEEKIEYETGRVESKTIKAQGEINKITASVAINGNLDNKTIKKVEDIVSNVIGLDEKRGDSISVVGMKFDTLANDDDLNAKDEINNVMKIVGYVVGILLLLILAILVYMYIKKKKNSDFVEDDYDDSEHLDIINQKIQEMEKTRSTEDEEESISLEEEVRQYASENKEQVTDLIRNWLSE
ncbi:flagellar basal-body MS-ring/collar protein FliF [Romboutsia timonensis]|uniref:flagellar basal-body MS-ring/collar protein FliF n=1 Tax=Romboutsia timonensis TaxID=1776391 RepID=UPI0008DA26B1|nr:flagellar basal-body MS-ring/collar protein FliF [Romboutsia timonensis]